jgi:hypothetical protein
MRYSPSALEVVVAEVWVATSVASTVAPETAWPAGSVIWPPMPPPVKVWARYDCRPEDQGEDCGEEGRNDPRACAILWAWGWKEAGALG